MKRRLHRTLIALVLAIIALKIVPLALDQIGFALERLSDRPPGHEITINNILSGKVWEK